MQKTFITLITCCFFILTSACTNKDYGNGKPSPELTFTQYVPITLPVVQIEVDEFFKTKIYKNDISKDFIMPLDVAFKRFVGQRFERNGVAKKLVVKIEHSYIKHHEIFSKGKFWKWSKIGVKDRYEAYMKLKVFIDHMDRTVTPHSVIEVKRYIIIPQKLSLAQRELAQLEFIELFIKDADQGIIKGLKDTLKII